MVLFTELSSTILVISAPFFIKSEDISIILEVVLECWNIPVSPKIPSIKNVAISGDINLIELKKIIKLSHKRKKELDQ